MDVTGFRNTTRLPGMRRAMFPVRSSLDGGVLSSLELIAIMPPMAVASYERGLDWVWVPFTTILATLLWQRIFAEVRRRPFIPDGLVPAMACAVILPATVPLWQAALSLSFGIVVSQEIFGGRGRNFLNPASVALAFFVFSFPVTSLEDLTTNLGLSVIPGALLLLFGGVISWRVLVGAVIGFLLAQMVAKAGLPSINVAQAGLIFCLVFLAADPVAAASTNPGRWLYGLFFGVTTTVLAGAAPPKMEAVVSATLFVGILAPLIDSAIIAFNSFQRGRRYG